MSLRPTQVNFDETWAGLSKTVQAVLTLRPVARAEWNGRFSDVYSLCVAQPEPLADRLYRELKELLQKHVSALRRKLAKLPDRELLQQYHQAWEFYNTGVSYLNQLFRYLNQQHIQKRRAVEPDLMYSSDADLTQLECPLEVGELAMELWRREMIISTESRLIPQLLAAYAADRDGDSRNSDALAAAVRSLVAVEQFAPASNRDSLHLYRTIFEKRLLEASGQVYRQRAAQLLQHGDAAHYVKAVSAFLREETERARRLLHQTSVSRFRQRCEQHLVSDHLQFLQEECQRATRAEDRVALGSAYPLLRGVPAGAVVMREELEKLVKERGLNEVWPASGQAPAPADFVSNVLNILERYHDLVIDAFLGDSSFTAALDRAVSRVVNHRLQPNTPCPAPEILARHCDTLLRRTGNTVDSELDEQLARAVAVFKYLDDKDVFQKFYARMLAKRLIFQHSLSMEAEEAMIGRLKQCCGCEFTSKFHRMFLDVSVSSDLNRKFEDAIPPAPGSASFSVQVLQAGAWPLNPAPISPFAPPEDLQKRLQSFESFYRHLFNGRKLTWLYHLCQGEVRLGYLKKPYVVTMQAFQLALLLMFERSDRIVCREACDALELNEDQFRRHCISLLESRIILLEGAKDVDGEGAIFRLNTDFSNKRIKFRLGAPTQRDPPEETKQTLSSVDEDRKMYLQAAIVRVMKSRKVLRHTALVQEVLSQSSAAAFAPSISLIKTCIEALIDKQYLERSPRAPDEYSYVA
ncbi:cullin-2-like [Schistocerca cancellata]|uniref:cullin-2-like n=1 Tax=Schistocerca cancellata TaxID=274614 RepID=UPI0021180B24|nr:cullin-2-like [Schistocerca cancellata]XP_049770564.1 cullin-2-like [Schistocerca cancellata]